MLLLLITKPFSTRNSSPDSDENESNYQADTTRHHLIGKWLKDEQGKLYCTWILE